MIPLAHHDLQHATVLVQNSKFQFSDNFYLSTASEAGAASSSLMTYNII